MISLPTRTSSTGSAVRAPRRVAANPAPRRTTPLPAGRGGVRQLVRGQGAGIDANTDADAALPGGAHHLHDLVPLADVAGVEAKPVYPRPQRGQRQPVIEVDVGD